MGPPCVSMYSGPLCVCIHSHRHTTIHLHLHYSTCQNSEYLDENLPSLFLHPHTPPFKTLPKIRHSWESPGLRGSQSSKSSIRLLVVAEYVSYLVGILGATTTVLARGGLCHCLRSKICGAYHVGIIDYYKLSSLNISGASQPLSWILAEWVPPVLTFNTMLALRFPENLESFEPNFFKIIINRL